MQNELKDIIANLRNLTEVIAVIEQSNDDSIFPLIKSNLRSDAERLEKVLSELTAKEAVR